MRSVLDERLQEIEELLLKMGSQVEEQIDLSLKALMTKDLELANRTIGLDKRTDNLELSIEKKCLDLIALQQPLAGDLRKISSVLKIITDLERIGDHCVNISKVTIEMGSEPFIKPLIDIPEMAKLVKGMVRHSLDSYVKANANLAIQVAKRDDLVDDLYERVYVDLLEFVRKDDANTKQVVNLLFIGRYLERIADHTTNICERVIYMTTGERKHF